MAMAAEWAMSTLNPQEAHVVCNRIAFDERKKTLSELGSEMRVSRDRVRQIEHKALRKMRNVLFRNSSYYSDILDILRNPSTVTPTSNLARHALPSDCRWVPHPSMVTRKRVHRKRVKKLDDYDWFIPSVKPRDYRTPQPYPYDSKNVPWIDGRPCKKLAKTWIQISGPIKYVHFEESKRLIMYDRLEKKGWVKMFDAWHNPKPSQVRSIMFCWCKWKPGYVWMKVTFASSLQIYARRPSTY